MEQPVTFKKLVPSKAHIKKTQALVGRGKRNASVPCSAGVRSMITAGFSSVTFPIQSGIAMPNVLAAIPIPGISDCLQLSIKEVLSSASPMVGCFISRHA